MDANPISSSPAKRSLVARIFRWLFLSVGSLALILVVLFWILFGRLLSLGDLPHGKLGEWIALVLFHLMVVAFLLYLYLTRQARPWLFSWRSLRRALVGAACLATFIAVFYAEENWRGRRAWEQCKRELEAQGHELDWEAYIPPPVPDDQNIFKAPKMREWFVRKDWRAGTTGGSESPKGVNCDFEQEFGAVAELIMVSPAAALPADADLVLQYNAPLLTLATSPAEQPGASRPALPNLPLVQKNPIEVVVDPAVQDRLAGLVHGVAWARTNLPPGANLMGSRNVRFVTRESSPLKPARVAVLTEAIPDKGEVARFFRTSATNGVRISRIEPAGSNSFHALLAPPWVNAAEFLAWSDQSEPDLNLIREAFQRHHARMDGDYQQPAIMPVPNFVGVRSVAQTLADRAKCHLLLGRPEEALRDLTLMHDLRRLLEPPPQSKNTTLVAAMIKVAVAGLYADTVADGFRINAWREPQLAALQAQLAEVDLLPQLAQSLAMEPAGSCRTMETATVAEWDKWFSFDRKNWFERLTSPMRLLLTVYPRGWRYQNMAVAARLSLHMQTGIVDLPGRVVSPKRQQKASEELEKQLLAGPWSPFHIFARIAIPNFIRALQTTARNQTLADEALIACALERWRLAHGQYPETLDALVPQFLAKLPHDLIGGQPLKYRRADAPSPSGSGAASGQFVLYSIGWNETDDGGQVAGKSIWEKVDQADWAWPQPAK